MRAMPALHRYQCDNQNCSYYLRAHLAAVFVALNAPTPVCPSCGGMKVTDHGEHVERPSHFSIGTGVVGRTDKTLRAIADQHGLSDINNKDGRPAKGIGAGQPIPKGKYGTRNFHGVEVPLNDTPTGAWGKVPYTPFKVAAQSKLPAKGSRTPPALIHAEHKGKI